MDINGKVAVVIGAASGLGLAAASALHAAGARVIATDVNADALAQAVDPLGAGVLGPAKTVSPDALFHLELWDQL